MPPVASVRPLWWMARWVTRLLTGFAVAAAFTVGAWVLPAQAAPVGQSSTVESAAEFCVVSALPPPVDAAVGAEGDRADLGAVPGALPAVTADGDAACTPAFTTGVAVAATATPGPRAARAPPRS